MACFDGVDSECPRRQVYPSSSIAIYETKKLLLVTILCRSVWEFGGQGKSTVGRWFSKEWEEISVENGLGLRYSLK